MKGAVTVFGLFFTLYLASMPPALAPYRDTGEMTVSAATLGVSHPTGYPLYILLGRLAEMFPLGNPAYRLTLLSVIAGVLALSVLFLLAYRRWGTIAACGAVLLLGLNSTFWSVSLVQEMYSLGLLGAVLLFWSALDLGDRYSEKKWLGFCLLYGLLLANRMDILLWAPGLLIIALAARGGPGTGDPPQDLDVCGVWMFLALGLFPAVVVMMGANWPFVILIACTAYWLYRGDRLPRWFGLSAGLAFIGFLVYAYLPIRSAALPWLDWNHPADPRLFAENLLRTRYGGTLDLISTNYAKGELFGVNLRIFGAHLWKNFSAVGLAAAGVGFIVSARRDFRRWFGMTAAFAWCGPIFLLMANMPPNPHALSIVEPHYLLADLILIFWAAEGLGALSGFREAGRPSWRAASAVLAALLLAVVPLGAQARWQECQRRVHLFTYDFAKNVFRSVPPGGILIAKKDVQLYTLWHHQVLHGWRKDITVIAQGLAGSPWYQAGLKRDGRKANLGPLREPREWARFLADNGPAFATLDSNLPGRMPAHGRGLVVALGRDPGPEDADLGPLMVRRGRYVYEGQPDFFTSDLVSAYAQADNRFGNALFKAGHKEKGLRRLKAAWSQNWVFPNPAVMLGYISFVDGDYERAQDYYGLAAAIYDQTLSMADEFRALAGVKAGILTGKAEALNHLGVTSERLGDLESARRHYRTSIGAKPTAQTYYNLAVLDWKVDPAGAEASFLAALRLQPGHAAAKKYLMILRTRRQGK